MPNIAKEFPQMGKELDKQNQVYLATGVVLDTYQIFSKTPIKSIKDLKGAKVAGAGYNMRYVEGLENADTVIEIYNIDGVLRRKSRSSVSPS